MAKSALLVLFMECCLIVLVKTAPSPVGAQDHERANVSGPEIHELETSDDFHFANSSNSNGSKVSSVDNIVDSDHVALKPRPRTLDVIAKVDNSGQDINNVRVLAPSVRDHLKSGVQSSVMTLPDDVITDALFTNIDTLQDHLEVCEERLRQQLRLRSHGKLLQDVETEEADYKTDRTSVNIHGKDARRRIDNKNDDEYEDDDEENEDDSDADDTDNEDDDVNSPARTRPSPSRMMEGKARNRRSVAGDIQGGVGGVPFGKSADLAQKVVQQLSARLDYLRSSLVQCHLLYRQFGLL